ncbi:TIR domain-containing protein [Rhodanobacter sp. B2A1Ga4]|uniref:TIR domain-containing protein n=1 Tax=Rhodanobacter sp. B2A1Ga4 TaxID=2778647 RepID=UPI001B37FEA5|nr:TIR domain-containing protein [Rhodanobacter sp. B2A1Ga4]MBQ4856202.1 TIR domain-containing protein [Rhodanobacter sp. B2A1Ga4]
MTQDSASPAFRYYAFISYSHQDRAWADWLHKALETYAVPKRLVGQATAVGIVPGRLTPIFRDRDELASAHDLGRKVNEALAQSANLIVICSPQAATSRWVNEEVLAFKRLGRSENVFCLIVAGEPNAAALPGREAEECLAPALRQLLDANGEPTAEPAEPIAADARPGKDGRNNAKLKLIAGLLGLDYDKLKQRELRRHNRRMAAITTLALVVMALTTTLAIAALFARHAAVVARLDAERRQKQAEDLVGFMLGDLNDKLAQVARLDIIQSVDDKAMEYFAALPTSDVTDEALEQRAKALEKIGTVRLDQGALPAALKSFRASAQLSLQLAAAAPTDIARQAAYARTLSYIGMTEWTQGSLDAAQQYFESAHKALLLAQSHSIHDLSLKFELQTTENNIGHVLEARGQSDAAAIAYQEKLKLSGELVAANPANTKWMSALGDAHNNLGKLALQRGDLAEAAAEYHADDIIETRLSVRDPRNNSQRENVLRVRAILGRTLAMTGDIDNGMQDLQQAIDIATQLVQIDPKQTSFQLKLAIYLSQLSRLKRLNGDLPAAQVMTDKSLNILSKLIELDPANASWKQYGAEVQIEQAAESLASGQASRARAQVQTALDTLKPLFAKQPEDRSLLLDTVTANLLLADASSDRQSAQRLRSDALKVTQGVNGEDSDPRLLALKVEALLNLQKRSEATPLIQRLWKAGYRDPALLAVLQRTDVDYPVNAPFANRIAQIMQVDATQVAHPTPVAQTMGKR